MRLSKVIFGMALAAAPVVGVMAEEPATLSDAIQSGTAHVNLRYRFENVDQDGIAKEAKASTLRTRINYGTLPWRGFSGFIEADNVSNLGSARFNSTRNGLTEYPVVADPDGTDLNQLYLKYAVADAGVTVGRQRINLDNQRFIGGVGWRQNEQTYDAVAVSYSGLSNLDLMYGYVNRIARVFGPHAGTPPASLQANSSLLHAVWNVGSAGRVVAYGYFLDFVDAASMSNRTLGVRYTNTFTAGKYKFPVTAEYARQNDYADNPASYAANYLHLEAAIKFGMAQFIVGDEILGTDTGAGIGFSTPLATLHGFQGWADKFLTTPVGGIDDRYVTFKASGQDTSFSIGWHDFNSDAGSNPYGNELDFSVEQKLDEHFGVLLKYASYNAETFGTDTQKLWVMLTVTF